MPAALPCPSIFTLVTRSHRLVIILSSYESYARCSRVSIFTFSYAILATESVSKNTNVLCKKVADEINAKFGLIFLRTECERQYDPEHQAWFASGLLIFDTNASETPEPPDDYHWLQSEKADGVEIHPQTESVIQYLKQFKDFGLSVNRERLHPYSHSGWFQEASKWLRESLMAAGHNTTTVTQFAIGLESSILRANTESGSQFYMKALPTRALNDEVIISCSLHRVMPEVFPKPLLVDEKRNWMVMSDYGQALSATECSLEENAGLVKKILCSWTEVQKRSIQVIDDLIQFGVPLHDDKHYEERVKEMLDLPLYIEAQWEQMSEEEKDKYGKEGYKQEFYGYVERLLARVRQYNIPLTIVHGDLNPVNVIPCKGETFTFIDHAYTCVSSPFLDALVFWNTCGGEVKSLDFYLELWTEFESMERLRELLKLISELDYLDSILFSLHNYKKAETGQLRQAREELAGLPCSYFSRHL